MNIDISQLPLAPLATIVAALITSAVAIINLTLNKQQKTADFRQAWVDELRIDLATFFSTARALGRAFEERRNPNVSTNVLEFFAFRPEKVGDMRLLAAESLYKIKLRLNPAEQDHVELGRLLDQIINKQNRINTENGADYSEAFDAIELAVAHSQSILKVERNLAKKEEARLLVVRNVVFPIIIIICIGLLFYYY